MGEAPYNDPRAVGKCEWRDIRLILPNGHQVVIRYYPSRLDDVLLFLMGPNGARLSEYGFTRNDARVLYDVISERTDDSR